MNTITIVTDIIFTFIYNMVVLIGSVYLIVEKDWSPWTLLVTIVLLGTWSAGRRMIEKEDDEPKIAVPPFTKDKEYE